MIASLAAVGLALAAADLPEGVDVQWTGAPGCPDAADVRERIAERLADREGPARASVIVALVQGAAGDYALSLDVELPEETVHRELSAASCDVLVDATAVVVGIAVEPQIPADDLRSATLIEPEAAPATVPEPLPPPRIEAPSEPEPTPEPEPEPSPEPAPAERVPRVGGLVRVHGGLSAGALPIAAGVAGLSLGIRGPGWRVTGGGDRTFRREHTFEGEPDVGARFTMWSASVRGCGVLERDRIEVPLCGGAEFGWMQAVGFGADVNRRLVEPWAALVASPGVLWLPTPRIGIGAAIDAFVPVWRPAFAGEGRGVLHQPFPVAARALATVEVRFGG